MSQNLCFKRSKFSRQNFKGFFFVRIFIQVTINILSGRSTYDYSLLTSSYFFTAIDVVQIVLEAKSKVARTKASTKNLSNFTVEYERKLIFYLLKYFVYFVVFSPIKAEHFEGSFFWVEGQFDPTFIFQEELT